MNASVFFLVFLLAAIAAGAVVVGIIYLAGRGGRSAAADRAELRALRDLVRRIDRLAYDSRDIAPELSIQITDEIARTKNGDHA